MKHTNFLNKDNNNTHEDTLAETIGIYAMGIIVGLLLYFAYCIWK